jgi:hypothetical protein
MSHFTVLVIGPDHETQLQPFHEFECTGTNDEFVKDIDVTDECREKGLDWHGLDDKTVTDLAQLDTEGEHKYGYALVDANGALLKAINRTNPNKHWDWWQVGGRWSGFFKLKDGATGATGEPGLMGSRYAKGDDRADQALKRDIDFAGMRDERGADAGATWDKAHAIIGEQTWESWVVVRERIKPIDAARLYYGEQAAVKALKEGDREAFGWDLDDTLSGSRDAYVAAARDRALATFAVVHKGEWSERGSMGWWGCVSGEMDGATWLRMFNDMLDGLPDDTLLTLVDCHI